MPYKKSGGKQCVVVGCTNSQKKLYEWENTSCGTHQVDHKDCPCLQPYKFHCIPVNEEKRRAWIKALNRKDFNPASKSLVCSIHFVDGRPTKENPMPALQMGYLVKNVTPPRRPLVRKSLNLNTPSKEMTSPEKSEPNSIDETGLEAVETLIATPLRVESEPGENISDTGECISVCCQIHPELCRNTPKLVDASTQTIDVVSLDHCYSYNKRTRNASCQQSAPEFSVKNVTSDSDSRFYTGLSLTVFLTLIQSLSKFGKDLPYKIPLEDQIFAVLVRLRLGLTFQDLGRRLNVSTQLMSSIFNSWIDIMSQHLSNCVVWLPRETIRRTLPSSFKNSYPYTTCIIDCSEVQIQRPFSLKARAQTWSTYKGHNTAKFLLSIAPNGFIMFVSSLYGGRASDNYITKNCGFLKYLLPGDEVMADRGFTVSEELSARRVKLNIPAFMKGRTQLSEQEVIETRRIASVRIHVERAIMRMKSFRILSTRLAIKSLKKASKIVSVIAALCNLRDPLIKESSDKC